MNYITKNIYTFLLNESDLKTWRKRKKKLLKRKITRRLNSSVQHTILKRIPRHQVKTIILTRSTIQAPSLFWKRGWKRRQVSHRLVFSSFYNGFFSFPAGVHAKWKPAAIPLGCLAGPSGRNSSIRGRRKRIHRARNKGCNVSGIALELNWSNLLDNRER